MLDNAAALRAALAVALLLAHAVTATAQQPVLEVQATSKNDLNGAVAAAIDPATVTFSGAAPAAQAPTTAVPGERAQSAAAAGAAAVPGAETQAAVPDASPLRDSSAAAVPAGTASSHDDVAAAAELTHGAAAAAAQSAAAALAAAPEATPQHVDAATAAAAAPAPEAAPQSAAASSSSTSTNNTVGTNLPPALAREHLGCFEYFVGFVSVAHIMQNHTWELSFEDCRAWAFENNFVFWGMMAPFECFAGTTLDSTAARQLPTSFCTFECEWDKNKTRTCGQPMKAISIFQISTPSESLNTSITDE